MKKLILFIFIVCGIYSCSSDSLFEDDSVITTRAVSNNSLVPLHQFHYRKNNFWGTKHNIYYYDTRRYVESDKGGYDGIVCHVYREKTLGTIPLYQFHRINDNRKLYYYDTRRNVESDKGSYDGIVCYIFRVPVAGAVPLYQFHTTRSDYGLRNYNVYYYDTRRNVESDKGYYDGVVGFVYP